jgi:hypothetical protein
LSFKLELELDRITVTPFHQGFFIHHNFSLNIILRYSSNDHRKFTFINNYCENESDSIKGKKIYTIEAVGANLTDLYKKP